MKPAINVSLNVSYYCNFRCSFCYLTEEQLGDRTKVNLELLASRIDEILADYTIEHVDLYGGEVLLLPKAYLLGIKEILHARGITDIVLITNLSLVNEIANDPDFEISVSYDFGAREKADEVLGNMFMLENRFTVLTLASRAFLDTVSVDEYVDTMNLLNRLKTAEIKPYSSNQANDHAVQFDEFENFVWAVINHPNREFYFENRSQVKEAVETGNRNAFSDNHIYITPTGDFAVLEFDGKDREFFLKVDGMAGYRAWCDAEKKRVNANPYCQACPYNGKCLSEHLREVVTLEHSCNGFKGLLDRWAAQ